MRNDIKKKNKINYKATIESDEEKKLRKYLNITAK